LLTLIVAFKIGFWSCFFEAKIQPEKAFVKCFYNFFLIYFNFNDLKRLKIIIYKSFLTINS